MKTTKKYNMSEIMKQAWSMWNDSTMRSVYKTWSNCLKQAWINFKEVYNEDLIKSLFSMNLGAKQNWQQQSYKIKASMKDEFNTLYLSLKGTFAAKIMMSIAKNQNGAATEKQLLIISKSL